MKRGMRSGPGFLASPILSPLCPTAQLRSRETTGPSPTVEDDPAVIWGSPSRGEHTDLGEGDVERVEANFPGEEEEVESSSSISNPTEGELLRAASSGRKKVDEGERRDGDGEEHLERDVREGQGAERERRRGHIPEDILGESPGCGASSWPPVAGLEAASMSSST